MNDANYYVLFSLISTVLYALVIICYIIPTQIREVVQADRWIKRLGIQLLILFFLSVLSIMPSLAYQYLRSRGMESETLRNIASVTGSISRLATIVVLILIYNYKRKE